MTKSRTSYVSAEGPIQYDPTAPITLRCYRTYRSALSSIEVTTRGAETSVNHEFMKNDRLVLTLEVLEVPDE